MKKLIDEMPTTFNSKLFEDIRNMVKSDIRLENLDLKNPENLKMFEQIYNTDALKNVLNKNKTENSSIIGGKYDSNHNTYTSRMNYTTNTDSSKISSHKSFFEDSSRKKQDLHSHSTKDNLDFSASYMNSSPLLPKEISLYNSPNNVRNGRGQQHKNLYDEFYQDENVSYGKFSNRNYGYGNDNYMFNSPPMKKMKVEKGPNLNMLEYAESNSNFHLVNKDKSLNSLTKTIPSQDWLNQGVKVPKNSQVGFTRTQMFSNSAVLYSPINMKYESPSR